MTPYFRIAIVFCAAVLAAPFVAADDVDVFLVLGQSNAGNFAETARTGATDVGFNLDFAGVPDRPDYLVGPSQVAQSNPVGTNSRITSGDMQGPRSPFSTNMLDSTSAVTVLAQGLYESNGVAVFSYIRNGAPIVPGSQQFSNGTPYYWGSDPTATPQPDNNSLYGAQLDWVEARIGEITARGDNPVVKGVFWYQGEGDAGNGVSAADYEDGLESLLVRLRDDYGAELPVVATNIRNGSYSGGATAINNAMNTVAGNDDFFDVVDPNSFSYRSGSDVHLNDAGLADLAPEWAEAYQALVPEPSSLALLGMGGLLLVRRMR